LAERNSRRGAPRPSSGPRRASAPRRASGGAADSSAPSAPVAARGASAGARAAASPPAPRVRARYEGLPVVVIAGRPNVGKSTLYNRLLHKRRAITDPTPGVTRDCVDSVWELDGAPDPDGAPDSAAPDAGEASLGVAPIRVARLFDTGGFKLDREGLDALVAAKSVEAIEGADLVLFLVDAVSTTPEDEEFAALLRKKAGKVVLVVNKADSPERDAAAYSYARWGFEPIVIVSAEHGRNIDELREEVIRRLDFSRVRKLDEGRAPIRLAIMGKPNTGKSTLLNRLVGEEKALVSEVAGTTRDIVEGRFERGIRSFVVLDTAGIRRKGKVTENVEYYSVTRSIKVVKDCDVVVLMVDAAEGLTEQDKKIAAFAVEEGRGVVIALNKWDAMPDVKNSFEAARDRIRYFFGQMAWAPILPLSAKDGTGVDKLMSTVVTLHAQLTKSIETSKLNKAVAEWVEATPPPVGPRTHFKLRYAVQTSINPQKFTIFVSRPDAVPEAYESFLRNRIREDLGMDKIPIMLEIAASRQPKAAKAPETRAGYMKRKEREARAPRKTGTQRKTGAPPKAGQPREAAGKAPRGAAREKAARGKSAKSGSSKAKARRAGGR
jgi:GTPase